MSHVDLGFLERAAPRALQSDQFRSKVGGKPAWLSLENLPKPENLQCETCKNPLIFLCQIYAPYEEDAENFHRTIFIFVCRTKGCVTANSSNNIQAIRSNLPRHNRFYSFEPPPERLPNSDFSPANGALLCNLCGCLSEKRCSKCGQVAYCSRQHQVTDWKEGHKGECQKNIAGRKSAKLFDEWEIVIEEEEINKTVDNNEVVTVETTMDEASESDLELFANSEEDKTFSRFKKAIEDNPEQVLRYRRGGQPLWIAKQPIPKDVPNCEHCGSPRQFEFQVMPQLLHILKPEELDWGVIAVYTCSKSCSTNNEYRSEFVFKQDVDDKNV